MRVRVEAEVLVVEAMPELVALGLEVAAVLGVRRRLDGHLFDDRQPEPFDPRELLRVVREDPDRRQAEVGEDLVPDPPVPGVGGKPASRIASTVSRPISWSS